MGRIRDLKVNFDQKIDNFIIDLLQIGSLENVQETYYLSFVKQVYCFGFLSIHAVKVPFFLCTHPLD